MLIDIFAFGNYLYNFEQDIENQDFIFNKIDKYLPNNYYTMELVYSKHFLIVLIL